MISSANARAFAAFAGSPSPACHAAQACAPPRLRSRPASPLAVAGASRRCGPPTRRPIRLEWGSIPSGTVASDSTPFRLTGKGTDGWLVALFQPAGKSRRRGAGARGVLDSVHVAARPLARGATLTAGDLRPATAVRWGTPTATVLPAEGWVTRRALAAGDELTPAIGDGAAGGTRRRPGADRMAAGSGDRRARWRRARLGGAR